jgi:hypothetical protein
MKNVRELLHDINNLMLNNELVMDNLMDCAKKKSKLAKSELEECEGYISKMLEKVKKLKELRGEK